MRVPFSAVETGQKIRFDSGYHMTGQVTKPVGTYGGKRMVWFAEDGNPVEHIISYAEHRSVVLVDGD